MMRPATVSVAGAGAITGPPAVTVTAGAYLYPGYECRSLARAEQPQPCRTAGICALAYRLIDDVV